MPLGARKRGSGDQVPAGDRPRPTGAADQAPPGRGDRAGTMIPARSKRSAAESFVMRIVATAGIVGICVGIAAIMASQNVQGWIIGLVVSVISVVLAGVLWSSRGL
jgi:hypothetical protein